MCVSARQSALISGRTVLPAAPFRGVLSNLIEDRQADLKDVKGRTQA